MRVRIQLVVGVGHLPRALTTAEVAVDDALVQRSRLYVENVDRLAASRLVAAGMPELKSIQWGRAGDNYSFTPFDRTDVPEFLHLLRPIYLEREPASFNRTRSAIHKSLRDTEFDLVLRSLRERSVRGDYQGFMQYFVLPPGAPSPSPIFDAGTVHLWLNGFQYHQDTEKRESVSRLFELLTQPVAEAMFLAQLRGTVAAMVDLAAIARQIAGLHPAPPTSLAG